MDLAMVAPAGETHTAQPGRAGSRKEPSRPRAPTMAPLRQPRAGPSAQPSPARPADGLGWSGWARMVPGPLSPEPRSPPPPDRKRGSTAGSAGNRGRAGTPRPVVPPGAVPVAFPHRCSLPAAPRLPQGPGSRGRRSHPGKAPPRQGPQHQRRGGAGPSAMRSLHKHSPPTNTVPTNTVPPLTCPPTMASVCRGEGAESRGPA